MNYIKNMKNKLFWPIIVVAVVIIIESVMLLSDNKLSKNETTNNIKTEVLPTNEVNEEKVFSFDWVKENNNKIILVMTANKEVSIDAIDLYIGYKGTKVSSIKNFGELPKATFSKISPEKSLVVMNYLISEADGFLIQAGKTIKIAELQITPSSTETSEFFIDAKTQVVENGTAKVLPFNSNNLIVNSTL